MLKDLLDNARAVILAVLVHVALLALLIVGLDWTPSATSGGPPPPEVVKAVAVDPQRVEAELERIRQTEARKREQEAARQQRLEAQAHAAQERRQAEETRLAEASHALEDKRRKSEVERARLAELRAAKALAEAERQRTVEETRRLTAEQARLQEQKRKVEREKTQLEAERRQAEKEKARVEAEKRKADEEKARAEAERRKALEAKKRAETERRKALEAKRRAETERRKAEQAKKRAEAARRKAEQARRRKQAEMELQAALAEEQAHETRRHQQLLTRLQNEYIGQIQAKVTRLWRRPLGVPKGLKCRVRVTQIPGGDIIKVRVVESSGNAAFDQSVEKAVWKASPLPRPRDSTLFLRDLDFLFSPEE